MSCWPRKRRLRQVRRPEQSCKKQTETKSNDEKLYRTRFKDRTTKVARKDDASNSMNTEQHDDNNIDEGGNDSEIIPLVRRIRESTDGNIEHPSQSNKSHRTTIRPYTEGHNSRINTDHTTFLANTPLKGKPTLSHHTKDVRIKATRNPIADTWKNNYQIIPTTRPDPQQYSQLDNQR